MLLNQINRYVLLRGLEISAEKYELIHILGPGRRPKTKDLPSYHINGSEITPKDSIKVLEVPIDEHLQLDYGNEEVMGKINQAKKLLRHLKISKLISNTSEWRQLFESFLRSLLIYSYTPMLAIDTKARIWADKNFTYAVAYILGIPRWFPHGLIQLMTNMSNTDESVQEQLIKGGTNINSSLNIRQAYSVLEEIFHLGGLLAYVNKHGKLPSR